MAERLALWVLIQRWQIKIERGIIRIHLPMGALAQGFEAVQVSHGASPERLSR